MDLSPLKEKKRLLSSTNVEKISTIYPPNSKEFFNKLNTLIKFPKDSRIYLDAPGHLVQFYKYRLEDRIYSSQYVSTASYKTKLFRYYCIRNNYYFEDTLINRAYLYHFMTTESLRVSFFKALNLSKEYKLTPKDLEHLSALSYNKLRIHIGELTPNLVKDLVNTQKPVKDLLHDPYFVELNRDPKDSNAYYTKSWPYLISWEAYQKPKKKDL